MSQLDDLTRFLRQHMPKRVMQDFDSQMDGIEFIPAQRDMGMGQYRLSVMKYDAVLTWERYPYREHDPQIMMALILVWREAAERGLFEEVGIDDQMPDIDIDLIDEGCAIVVVTLPMVEAITLIEDEKGEIPFDGQRWRLDAPAIWTAEDFELTRQTAPGDA